MRCGEARPEPTAGGALGRWNLDTGCTVLARTGFLTLFDDAGIGLARRVNPASRRGLPTRPAMRPRHRRVGLDRAAPVRLRAGAQRHGGVAAPRSRGQAPAPTRAAADGGPAGRAAARLWNGARRP